jgi:hypothetical protein
MVIKHLLLLLIAGMSSLFGFLPLGAHVYSANEPTSLKNVTLWIYPEYDDPRLLVMLEGQISGASTPALIRFLVPTQAEMFSAGSKDPQGKYTGGPPDRSISSVSGWDVISYDLKNPTFRVEYYDPIIIGKIEKTISYDFISFYPINSLEVIVQIPSAASNFSSIPKGTQASEGNFKIFTSKYTDIQANRSLHFDISYSKSDPNPSLGGTTPSNQESGTWNLLPLLIFGGVIIIAGTLIWAIKASRKDRQSHYPSTKTNRKTDLEKSRSLPDKYCSQCGKRLELPSKFCPFCRYKLK